MNLRLIVCAAVACSALSAQADLYVDQSVAIGTNDGLSWATAFPTLDQALLAAANGDEIWVATGKYTPRVRTDAADPRSVSFNVRQNLTVIGGFVGNETSIAQWPALSCTLSGELGVPGSADNAYHVVRAENDGFGSTLQGFTVRDGNAVGAPNPNGGGVLAFNNSLLSLRDCEFLANEAEKGGAIYIDEVGGATLVRCLLDGNSSTDAAGAIGCYGGGSELAIANCTFRNNSAGGFGGAIVYFRSRPSQVGAFPTVTNTVFSRNTAQGKGGAVFVRKGIQLSGSTSVPGSSAFFYQCTFYKNESAVEGGAIYANTTATPPAVCEVRNSILWNNTAPTAAQYGGGGLAIFSNVEGGYAGTGNINADPLFTDVGIDDFRLLAGSPSVDTGSVAELPLDWFDLDGDTVTAEPLPVDLDLNPRVRGTNVDMGAYER